jgi:hypothetical protein
MFTGGVTFYLHSILLAMQTICRDTNPMSLLRNVNSRNGNYIIILCGLV